MRLTTKGRFAVTAMIDLALREHTGPVALAAISQRQQISLSYLEQLFGKLRRHELVESTRGPGGGYSLGRKAEDIRRVRIRTHEAAIRIIDKQGPLNNPADRDHCIQYMTAVPLLFGRLTDGGRLSVDIDDQGEVLLDIHPTPKKDGKSKSEPQEAEI